MKQRELSDTDLTDEPHDKTDDYLQYSNNGLTQIGTERKWAAFTYLSKKAEIKEHKLMQNFMQ